MSRHEDNGAFGNYWSAQMRVLGPPKTAFLQPYRLNSQFRLKRGRSTVLETHFLMLRPAPDSYLERCSNNAGGARESRAATKVSRRLPHRRATSASRRGWKPSWDRGVEHTGVPRQVNTGCCSSILQLLAFCDLRVSSDPNATPTHKSPKILLGQGSPVLIARLY